MRVLEDTSGEGDLVQVQLPPRAVRERHDQSDDGGVEPCSGGRGWDAGPQVGHNGPDHGRRIGDQQLAGGCSRMAKE
jgi:hypothetical protein